MSKLNEAAEKAKVLIINEAMEKENKHFGQVPKIEESETPICSLYGYGLWIQETPTPKIAVNKVMLIFLGELLTNIFQMGCFNHQPDKVQETLHFFGL